MKHYIFFNSDNFPTTSSSGTIGKQCYKNNTLNRTKPDKFSSLTPPPVNGNKNGTEGTKQRQICSSQLRVPPPSHKQRDLLVAPAASRATRYRSIRRPVLVARRPVFSAPAVTFGRCRALYHFYHRLIDNRPAIAYLPNDADRQIRHPDGPVGTCRTSIRPAVLPAQCPAP